MGKALQPLSGLDAAFLYLEASATCAGALRTLLLREQALPGAPLGAAMPASIVAHGLAFNITVQSYAGSLEFGLTACRDVVARPAVVAGAIATAFAELVERTP